MIALEIIATAGFLKDWYAGIKDFLGGRCKMSKLLIDEPPLQVLPTLAVKVGIGEAIFLQQLHCCLQKSKNVSDGRPWVYNTYEDWQRQFPFWSKKTIQRIIYLLEEQGILLSRNDLNTHKLVRTKWYSISYTALENLLNGVNTHFPKRDDHADS